MPSQSRHKKRAPHSPRKRKTAQPSSLQPTKGERWGTYASLPWERWEIWTVAAIGVLGIGLRFFRAASKGLWIDETTTQFDAIHILRPGFYSQSHFLAFMFFRAALRLGRSELALRLPSLLFSSLSVPMIFLMLRRWCDDRRIAFLGAALTAVSLYQLHFAQEARYYGMVTFFSAWSMLVLRRLLAAPAWPPFLLFLLVNLLNYGVHPATAVFFAAQMMFWLGWGIAQGGAKRAWRGWRSFTSKPAPLVVGAHMAALAILALVVGLSCQFLLGRHIYSLLLRFSNLPHWELTPGVGFSVRFFLMPVNRFALLHGEKQGLSPFVGHIYSALFVIGLAAGLVRFRWQTAFALTAYGATDISLFIYRANIPYSEKYVIFLYPSFVLLVCLGVLTVCQTALRPLSKASAPRWGGIAGAAALMALQAAQYRDYHSFYAYEFEPYRATVEYVRSQTPEGGILVTNQRAFDGLDCYRRQHGFDDGRFFVYSQDASLIPTLLRRGEPLWFCPIVQTISNYPRKELERILAPFQDRGATKSYGGGDRSILRYYADGRLVCFPGLKRAFPVRFVHNQAMAPDEPAFVFQERPDNEWAGRLSLYAMAPASYGLRVSGAGDSLNHWSGRAQSADGELALSFQAEEDGGFAASPFAVSEGPFALEVSAQGLAPPSDAVMSLCPQPGSIPARLFAGAHSFGGGESIVWKGREAYVFRRNAVATYEIETDQGGPYQFFIEAVHDQPPPVWTEVAVNETPLGILSFDKGDNEFGALPFAAPLRAGLNRIDVSFLNAGLEAGVNSDLTDQDRDFILRELRWRPLAPGEEGTSAFIPETAFMADVPSSRAFPSAPWSLAPP